MEPGVYDFKVWRGSTFRLPLAFRQADGAGGFVPFSLAGAGLVFQAVWPGGAMQRQTGVDAGFTIDDPAGGLASLLLAVDDTRQFAAASGEIRYEIRLLLGAEVTTWLYGTIGVREWADSD